MKKLALCSAFVFLGLCVSPTARAGSVCPVKDTVPAKTRIYARTNSEAVWLQYHTLEDVPPLQYDGGAVAEFWEDKGKMSSAYIVEGVQDISITTRYCFDGDGNLQGVGFDVRTALGWGHRAEGKVTDAGFEPKTSEYFNLKNNKLVPRPDGVVDMPRAVKPILYMKRTDLPFASQLQVAENETKKKHSKQDE